MIHVTTYQWLCETTIFGKYCISQQLYFWDHCFKQSRTDQHMEYLTREMTSPKLNKNKILSTTTRFCTLATTNELLYIILML